MATFALDHPDKLQKKVLKIADKAGIYYDTYYTNDPYKVLILLHGASGDSSGWHIIRNRLYDAGYSTLAIDFRGHGFSSRSNREEFYAVDNIIKDILAIVKEENLKKYLIVGHCYGANIALKLAAQRPQELLGVAAINTSYKTGVNDLYQKLGPIRKVLLGLVRILPTIGKAGQTDFSRYIGTGDLNVRRILATIWHNTLQSYLFTFNNVLTLNTLDDLPKITCPVSVIGGGKDSFFQPDTIHALQSKIKNSEAHIVPHADHITNLNVPEEISDLVIDFVQNKF